MAAHTTEDRILNVFVRAILEAFQSIIPFSDVRTHMPEGERLLAALRSLFVARTFFLPLPDFIDAIFHLKPGADDNPNDHDQIANHLLLWLNPWAPIESCEIVEAIKLSAKLAPNWSRQQRTDLAERVLEQLNNNLYPPHVVDIIHCVAPVMAHFDDAPRQELLACFTGFSSNAAFTMQLASTYEVVKFIQAMTSLCRNIQLITAQKTATQLAELAMAKNALKSSQIAPVLTALAGVLMYLTAQTTTDLVSFATRWLLRLLPAQDQMEDESEAHPNLNTMTLEAIARRFNNIADPEANLCNINAVMEIVAALLPYVTAPPAQTALTRLILIYAEPVVAEKNRVDALAALIPAWGYFDDDERNRAIALLKQEIEPNRRDCWEIMALLDIMTAIWPGLEPEEMAALTADLATKLAAQMAIPLNLYVYDKIMWTIPAMTFLLAHSNSTDHTELAQTTFVYAQEALQKYPSGQEKLVFLHLLVRIWPHLTAEDATKTTKLIFVHLPAVSQWHAEFRSSYPELNLFDAMQDQWPRLPSSVGQQLAGYSAYFILNIYLCFKQKLTIFSNTNLSDAMALLGFAQALSENGAAAYKASMLNPAPRTAPGIF